MEPSSEAFKAMLLREFFLEPRLAQEFQAARILSGAGKKLARPLSKVVAAKLGIPAEPVELAVRAITGERFTALPVRTFSDVVAMFRSAEDSYFPGHDGESEQVTKGGGTYCGTYGAEDIAGAFGMFLDYFMPYKVIGGSGTEKAAPVVIRKLAKWLVTRGYDPDAGDAVE